MWLASAPPEIMAKAPAMPEIRRDTPNKTTLSVIADCASVTMQMTVQYLTVASIPKRRITVLAVSAPIR